MKMYIAVLDAVPDHMVPVLVAHATLTHHLEKHTIATDSEYDSLYRTWLKHSYAKCVVRVSEREFMRVLDLPEVTKSFENKTLEGRVSCAVVVVADNVPNVLKFAKLWKPDATV